MTRDTEEPVSVGRWNMMEALEGNVLRLQPELMFWTTTDHISKLKQEYFFISSITMFVSDWKNDIDLKIDSETITAPMGVLHNKHALHNTMSKYLM